jgi:hypothetical protein
MDVRVSVFVSGNDVYVVGDEIVSSGTNNTICHSTLWRNGVAQRLSNNNESEASSVFVK